MMKRLLTILACSLFLFSCDKEGGNARSADSAGQGGSLARFTIAREHLYIVDHQKLYTYSLANRQAPQLKSTVNVGFDVETIYPYRDKLFIGSGSAMYIYSIADAAQPEMLGTASHVRACDPVVANDSLAYVTVRSNGTCGGDVNALIIYDVRNVLQPVQRNTVPLSGPWGLGMNGNRLYVCNGADGLNVYDISSPVYPSLVKKMTTETFYDVIIRNNNLLIGMVQGGTALYGIKPNDELELYSRISN